MALTINAEDVVETNISYGEANAQLSHGPLAMEAPTGDNRLTAEEATLLECLYEDLCSSQHSFAEQFLRALETEEMLHSVKFTDLQEIENPLMATLAMLVSEARCPERVVPALRAMALEFLGSAPTRLQVCGVVKATLAAIKKCIGASPYATAQHTLTAYTARLIEAFETRA